MYHSIKSEAKQFYVCILELKTNKQTKQILMDFFWQENIQIYWKNIGGGGEEKHKEDDYPTTPKYCYKHFHVFSWWQCFYLHLNQFKLF